MPSSWVECDCWQRHAAQKRGEFFYATLYRGWMFDDGPFRVMTTAARYFRYERELEDHTGEPMIWYDCPYCGLVLPQPIVPVVTDQADGERGG